MDAGGPVRSSSSNLISESQSRLCPLEEQLFRRRNAQENLDRFIPNRSAMDFDYALLTQASKGTEAVTSYGRRLAEAMNMNRTQILAFKNKPPARVELFPPNFFSENTKPKPRRHIGHTPNRTLEAIDIVDDYRLNLLDWGSSGVLAIALSNSVYFWDGSSASNLVSYEDESVFVTSVSWAPNGRHIAIGLNNSEVELWDSSAKRKLSTFSGRHRLPICSLAWNNDTLTTGGMDGRIINHDARTRSHTVNTDRGHKQEVCGLTWSVSGHQLASGGSDHLVHIWDSRRSAQWLHRLEDHSAAVRALAWCPFQGNLLASGGGEGDCCLKFWNSQTGSRLNSVYTGFEVCALLWNKNERELLSAHGGTDDQLTLWKYPSMAKIAELTGHTSRVLYMTQSPDNCTVASAAGDEKLNFWNVFGVPEVAKLAPRTNTEPFAQFNRMR